MNLRRSAGGATSSIWMTERALERDQPPPDDVEALVIGGGIAGLTTAVELARRGKRVALIDDGALGDGETGRTSAHLASAVDDRYAKLERTFGKDGAKLVAYRDEDGQCHVMSAVCTHLKGIVQWNAAEKTWDCPCHGSRFDEYGVVVNGPALTNLEPLETPLAEK